MPSAVPLLRAGADIGLALVTTVLVSYRKEAVHHRPDLGEPPRRPDPGERNHRRCPAEATNLQQQPPTMVQRSAQRSSRSSNSGQRGRQKKLSKLLHARPPRQTASVKRPR